KLPWILQKQRFARENYLPPAPKGFVSGEKFLYLGEEYELCVIPGAYGPLVFDGKEFFLREGCTHLGRWLFRDWYREQAAEYFSGRVRHYAGMTGARYSGIGISDAKGRWGSCSSKGVLNFNWRLVMAPREVADYVVVHEVAHLRELNHSKRFWEKVRALMPDFPRAKRWLDLHPRLLHEDAPCAPPPRTHPNPGSKPRLSKSSSTEKAPPLIIGDDFETNAWTP
ncbi:MAG: SprT family zinc-dependent metalloprotease, partial [Deltaproteobacteria bacterium]